jgi:AraC family transcriptional regulator of arabinose operon
MWMPGTTHNFGCADEDQEWEIVWAHFEPPSSWLAWLSWAELAPGIRWVPAPDPQIRARVDTALLDSVAAVQAPTLHAVELSMNALERALLWLDQASPEQGPVDGRIHDAIDFIARHLEQPLDLATIAASVNLSRSRLSHLFSEQIGVPLARYIEQRRMERAKQLLSSSSMTIGAISRATGFSSQFYFATRFKSHAGTDPTSWRARRRQDAPTGGSVRAHRDE